MAIFQDNPAKPVREYLHSGAKDDKVNGDKWSYKTLQNSSNTVITTKRLTPGYLQAECPSCHPTNGVKPLKR